MPQFVAEVVGPSSSIDRDGSVMTSWAFLGAGVGFGAGFGVEPAGFASAGFGVDPAGFAVAGLDSGAFAAGDFTSAGFTVEPAGFESVVFAAAGFCADVLDPEVAAVRVPEGDPGTVLDAAAPAKVAEEPDPGFDPDIDPFVDPDAEPEASEVPASSSPSSSCAAAVTLSVADCTASATAGAFSRIDWLALSTVSWTFGSVYSSCSCALSFS